jgi:hypothetical protein
MGVTPIHHLFDGRQMSLSLAISLLAATPAPADSRPVVAGRLQPEWAALSGKFGVGADRRMVIDMIGLPAERVGDTLWIYYQCSVVGDDSRARGLDALVVVFRQHRVVALRLTASTALRELIAKNKLKVTKPSYADLLR